MGQPGPFSPSLSSPVSSLTFGKTQMSSNRENFRLWYENILGNLYGNGDAGFAILIIALPLLERYLRQKSGIYEAAHLTPRFYQELRQIFPAIPDDDTANKFWHVFRNGLLHQVTLSQSNRNGVRMPDAWLSSHVDAISIGTNGEFWVHPSKFASIVVNIIENDFATFEGRGSTSHPFPIVDILTDGTGCIPQTGVPPPDADWKF